MQRAGSRNHVRELRTQRRARRRGEEVRARRYLAMGEIHVVIMKIVGGASQTLINGEKDSHEMSAVLVYC